MKEVLKNKYVQYVLVFVGVITTFIPIIGSFWNGIDVDSAIILTEMERIYEGYVPYKTMHLNYPPLWFYINVALKWLFHVPYGCYHFYLGIHWVYVLGCATCLFYISKQWNTNTGIAFFVAWLFIIVTHWPQGNIILFEIPSLFWGLLAIVLALKWKKNNFWFYTIVGAFTCCSFLTKQFGAGFFLLLAWLIIVSQTNNKWKQLGAYLGGYFIPLVICFAYWGTDIFRSILFNGYGTKEMDAYWGTETTLPMLLHRIFDNLLLCSNRIVPIVYAAVVLLPFIIKQNKWRESLLCFFAIGGFGMQFFFVHGGHHYYLYIIPFALLFVPILLSLEINKYIKYGVWVLSGIMVLLGIYSSYHNRVWKVYMHDGKKQYEHQMVMGKRVADIVNEGETVFIPHGGLCYIYYTGNLYPSCMAEIGYGVGPMEVTIETASKWTSEATYVLHFTNKLMYDLYQGKDYEYFYTDSLKQYVDQFPSDTLEKETVIHYLKLPPIK